MGAIVMSPPSRGTRLLVFLMILVAVVALPWAIQQGSKRNFFLLVEVVSLLLLLLSATIINGMFRRQRRLLDDLKAQHESAARVRQVYRTILAEGDVLLQGHNEREILERTCDRLVTDGAFAAVWIARPTSAGGFALLAHAGQKYPQAEEGLSAGSGVLSELMAQARKYHDVSLPEEGRTTVLGVVGNRSSRGPWASALAAPISRDGAIKAVMVFLCAEGRPIGEETIDLCKRVAGLLGHGLDAIDNRDRIKSMQAREAHLARTDMLTQLPNRLALEQYVPYALTRARRHNKMVAVGLLDLDDFKPVNDRYGHEAGDTLLRTLARRMRESLRESDFIARMGGDEFVILIEELDDESYALQLNAELARLHEVVESTFDLENGKAAKIGMTMGLALFPKDGTDLEELLRQADAAMYVAKQNKLERAQWWNMSPAPPQPLMPEILIDPFGVDACALLGEYVGYLEATSAEFAESFYQMISEQAEPSFILENLRPDEFAALKAAQARHLRFLLSPQTTREAVEERARHLGQVHSLVGVTGAWMSRSMGVYRELLRNHMDDFAATSRDRFRLFRAAEARLQIDVQAELDAMQAVGDIYNAYLSREMPTYGTWADLAQNELDALALLPGILDISVFHLSPEGVFRVDFAAGAAPREAAYDFRKAALDPLLDAEESFGEGFVAQAWLSGRVQRAITQTQPDPQQYAWVGLAEKLGVRSAVALPVRGDHDTVFILVLLGAYPNQFGSGWIQTFVASLQNRWEHLARMTHSNIVPVDAEVAASYRELLYSGGLRMFMQPVSDLRTGEIVRVEALARLKTAEGEVITPGQFLPALREDDIHELFRRGLEQSLESLRGWHELGLQIDLSINLPPATLVRPECAAWVRHALKQSHVEPSFLTLELLETQDFNESAIDAAMARLTAIGVKLAIDDLGSGYSSLKRLATLPFHTVKIDQSIVGNIRSDPLKTLSLMRTIVQIGKDFEIDVVGEGLEDADIIEAARILGCAFGQGFGLGRPMPACQLHGWANEFTFDPPSSELQTLLGALAYHWMTAHGDVERAPYGASQCPVHRFLLAKGLLHGPIVGMLERFYASEGDSFKAARRDVRDWLIAAVRAG